MGTPREFVTTDPGLAAAIMTATGAPPSCIRPGMAKVEYVFRADRKSVV